MADIFKKNQQEHARVGLPSTISISERRDHNHKHEYLNILVKRVTQRYAMPRTDDIYIGAINCCRQSFTINII